ncbi:MAG: hypothetical protein AAFS10_10315 [Myxococcota bacterium]
MQPLHVLQHELQARHAERTRRQARWGVLGALSDTHLGSAWGVAALGWSAAPALLGPVGSTATWVGLSVAAVWVVLSAWSLQWIKGQRRVDWERLTQMRLLVDDLARWLPSETPIRLDDADPHWLRVTIATPQGDLRCTVPQQAQGDLGCALYGDADALTSVWKLLGRPEGFEASRGVLTWGRPLPESWMGDPGMAVRWVGQALDRVEPRWGQKRRTVGRVWPQDPLRLPSEPKPVRPLVCIGLAIASSCGALAVSAAIGGQPTGMVVGLMGGALLAMLVGVFMGGRVSEVPVEPFEAWAHRVELSQSSWLLGEREVTWIAQARWTVHLPEGDAQWVEATLVLEHDDEMATLKAMMARDDLPEALPTRASAPDEGFVVAPSVYEEALELLMQRDAEGGL